MSELREDDWDGLAARYALGTLEDDERARFDKVLEASAEARALLADWEDRLATALASGDEVSPPTTLWPRLQPRVRDLAPPSEEEATDEEALEAAFRQAVEAAHQGERRWRQACFAALAAVLMLVVFIALGGTALVQPPERGYLAVLQAEDAPPALLVDATSERIIVRSVKALQIPRNRSLELWAITSETGAPRSLGLLDAGGSAELPLPPNLLERPGLSLAVSMEPKGGSLTGQPTGPVLLRGGLERSGGD